MTAHFIITRPLANCHFLKENLPSECITYVPVMGYEEINDALKIKNACDYDYIITSQYAAKMILEYNFSPKSTYYCVGTITENILKQNGYITLSSSEHNVSTLINVIKNTHQSTRKLLYLSGETIKQPIQNILKNHKIHCTQCIIYKTIPIHNNLHKILHSKTTKTIVFYSKQSYDLFIKDVKVQNLTDTLQKCHAVWVLPAQSAKMAWCYTNNVTWQNITVLNSTNDLIHFIRKEYTYEPV
jgi:uroporphyrinogen-III synthase